MSRGLNAITKEGYEDAKRGHTACKYGTEREVRLWDRGYELADKDGVALFPRFGKRRKKNAKSC